MDEDGRLDWLRPFDGRDLETKLSQAASLATVDAEGWPHLAYLSVGEVLAEGRKISLALWPTSRTTRNLDREGRAVLHAAFDGAVWQGRLQLSRRGAAEVPGEPVIFAGEVVAVSRHVAPYAEVTGLISYLLKDVSSTLARWELQMQHLRSSRQ